MKKAILLAIIIFNASIITAQNRIALVAGVHQSDVIETNNLPDWVYTGSLPDWDVIKKKYSPRIGMHIGFIAQVPFSEKSKLFFMPGAIYHNKGRKYDFTSDTTALLERSSLPDTLINTKYNYQQKQYLNYIDIPLNLVYKFSLGRKVKFLIGAGPYFSFFFSGSDNRTHEVAGINKRTEENEDLPVGKGKGQYSTIDYGVNGLAGFEFGRIFLTAKYSRGINNFYQSTAYDGGFKHELIGGTLGIFLGKPVAVEKKIKDKDKDGIPDDKDNCPEEAGPSVTNGCPDKDGDGIADNNDKCPDQPGLTKNNGCPDKDNDGVTDKDDKCPDVAGMIKYNGCPVPDSDKDGINDEEDKCPLKAGIIRYGGCPVPDGDSDGINDDEDNCPALKGTKENNGCPAVEIKKEIVEKVNYAAKHIQFQSAKAVLQSQSFQVLDEVAQILMNNPELKLLIEGHTSADGTLASNMKLSVDRAEIVKKYLLSKGIEESRLTTKGYGPAQPLNKGKTSAERYQNRRVELKLSN